MNAIIMQNDAAGKRILQTTTDADPDGGVESPRYVLSTGRT